MLQHAVNRSAQRAKIFARFQSEVVGNFPTPSCIFLEGGTMQDLYDTDTELPFIQEANFQYVTGLDETPHHPLQVAMNLQTKETILFIPKLGLDYSLWCVAPPSVEEFKQVTKVDQVRYTSEISSVLVDQWNVKQIFTKKQVPSSLKDVKVPIDTTQVYPHFTYCRFRKTDDEVEALAKVGHISALAHKKLMQIVRPGINEYELDALFKYECGKYGVKHMAYQAIIAGDDRGATLHYTLNNQECHDGSLVLVDAGARLNGYISDITRTYPVNGKFTTKQREIYEIVLEANKQVIQALKPGVEWTDMHLLAERIIAEGLLRVGILKGSLEKILETHTQALFLPHGLGHSYGLDTHDPPNRDGSFPTINRPGIKFLRVRGVLEKGVCMTVEPGIYFIPAIWEDAKQNHKEMLDCINWEKLEEYRNFGGVRIEDNIVVTETGCRVLTSEAPKEVEEIEAVIAAK